VLARRFAAAGQAHDLEARRLGGEASTAADGSHFERGEAEAGIEAVVAGVHRGDGVGALDDLGGVLTGREKGRGDRVRGVGVEAETRRLRAADEVLPGVPLRHRLGRGLQDVVEDGRREVDVGRHRPAAALDGVDGRGLLVGTEVAREGDQVGIGVRLDEIGGLTCGDRGHVHPHGVLRVVGEPQEDVVADDVGDDPREFAVARGGFGRLAEVGLVVAHPRDDPLGGGHVGDLEDGRAGHPGLGHAGRRAAGLADGAHAAVDARDQGALGRGHGQVVLAVGRAAVDGDGPGDAHRDLGGADEVLDVRVGRGGVEGEVADGPEVGVGLALENTAPRRRGRLVVGVVLEFVEAEFAGPDPVGEALSVGHTRRWGARA
jgi:hypothetical protein